MGLFGRDKRRDRRNGSQTRSSGTVDQTAFLYADSDGDLDRYRPHNVDDSSDRGHGDSNHHGSDTTSSDSSGHSSSDSGGGDGGGGGGGD